MEKTYFLSINIKNQINHYKGDKTPKRIKGWCFFALFFQHYCYKYTFYKTIL